MIEEDMPAEDNSKNLDAPEVAVDLDRDDRGRFVIEEAPEAVEEVKVVEEVKPKTKPKPAKTAAKSAEAVEVSLAALVYSARKRNSASVAALQDRLAALDYASVRSDLRGWYHDGTKKALESWQKNSGLEVTGECSKKDAEALFGGQNVELV